MTFAFPDSALRASRRTASAALLVALAFPHAAFAQGTPVSGGALTWGVETEPRTLNPQLNGQDKVELLLRNAYESLLAQKPDGSYVPWLATGYKVSADGKTYTFTLRDGVKFTDGAPFDAKAVARNFLNARELSYSAGSQLARLISHVADVKTPDEHTVAITLDAPYAPFLTFAGRLPLLSPNAFDRPSLKSGGPDIAGTGPFILRRYVKGQEIEFAKNPDYRWAPPTAGHQGPAYLDRIVYRFLPESSVRTGALLSGQVDVIEGVSGNDAALIRKNADFTYRRALNTGTPYSLFLNVGYGPTQDVKVRRALLEGLDITGIVQSIYRGERTRAWGVTSPIDPLYVASIEKTYGNNPKLANQLLDEAGWNVRDSGGYRTKSGERLTIAVIQAQATVRDQRDVLLQALQAQARQRLGVDLKIQYVDDGTYVEARKSGKFGSIANSNTPPDGIDIEGHYLPVDRGGALNYSRAAAPELTRWLQAAARTQNIAERKKLYGELQHFAINEQAYAVPLYEPEDQIAAAKAVQGLRFRSFAQMPENPYDVWIKK
ncbi:ABC transporter substrate-binding protein [Burkholderia cepacia]|uniref:ABC transporter substrate-binding protein n=1 Tax=Burkholderia TaxID=32008 RepID=UPI000F5AE521|nr:ABC transporter substrate-binding protein [Burkholderia cepacia]MCA8054519.1 ABC transporter substrate-binding protein [Burkholderia cepacia]MCA8131243.1 ABC transporter substrate-binding protein [Burkholderia cepacia]MCA8212935.1 ABC transporter substrate-binding protein [Burkholderia cepacia]MDN7890076.1 ABC transporter substrate-binding protein [Burkholderia cepacia]RQT60112.1 ABC transporter substrate-binding protein [Burkholderia cepacia]